MRRIFTWLNKRFRTFDLLPEYFTAAGSQMQDILWGALLPFLAWGIWFVLGNPPMWVNATAIGLALFMAGYYVWRADHVRLLPQLKANGICLQETPTSFETITAIYVQVDVRCLTEAPVHECRGHLVRVRKKDSDQDQWEATEMNESLYMGWSHRGFEPLTLEPGAEPRLNICHWSSNSTEIIPEVKPLPLRAAYVFDSMGIFRFDVRITSKDCAPIDFWVSVSLDKCKWNEPVVKLIRGGENGDRSATRK
jgi:hypothetical protein